MNDHDAFLRTIFQQPDDDAPRLVYADWLEENGYQNLAEFIRVQIELNRLGHRGADILLTRQDTEYDRRRLADPDKASLLQRETELFEKRVSWRRLPPKWIEHSIGNYRRGLLYQWRGRISDLFKYGDEIWSYGPVVELSLSGKDVDFVELANSPLLGRIQVLHVNPNSVIDQGGMALAASRHVEGLISLIFWRSGKWISDRAFSALTKRFGDSFRARG